MVPAYQSPFFPETKIEYKIEHRGGTCGSERRNNHDTLDEIISGGSGVPHFSQRRSPRQQKRYSIGAKWEAISEQKHPSNQYSIFFRNRPNRKTKFGNQIFTHQTYDWRFLHQASTGQAIYILP
jgi:hypothetical protein